LVPVTLEAYLVEAVMPLPSSVLQLLLLVGKERGKLSQRKCKHGRDERGEEKLRNPIENPPRGTRHVGPTWICRASFSVFLSEAPWPRNSCHSS
jgi:hypothetical protein